MVLFYTYLGVTPNEHGKNRENQDSVEFDYKNGGLENTKPYNSETKFFLNKHGIREHICNLMEGGIEAFNKRKKTYDDIDI